LLRLRSQWQQLDGLWPLLGVSPAIQLAMRRAQLATHSAVGVLITGPKGSGKSEIARAIFALRARGLELPASAIHALPIDCSLVDEQSTASMLETLAARLRPGAPLQATHLILDRFDRASQGIAQLVADWLTEHGSTLCVVATSELPAAQLAARNALLARLVQSIGTVEIDVPALFLRREDVAALAQHHLSAAAQRAGRRLPGIAPNTMELLEAFAWPGNAVEVRQVASEMLNNAVLTATIQPSHLPLQLRTFAGTLSGSKQPTIEPLSLDEVLLDLERVMLERAIKLSPRNRARAARLLGISRPRFLRRIAQLGLDGRPSDEEE
jgi:DNA-binding NtrC family response regulator